MTSATANEVLRLRLRSQRIEPTGSSDIAAAVRHMLAVQAQDFAQALWGVALRSGGVGRSEVLAALARGEVVRSMPMRGTLHFVAPEDLRWMLAVTAERTLRSAATRFRTLDLDQATLDRAENIALESLSGGESMSRDEFMTQLRANGIEPGGQRGYHVIFYLLQRAVLCWGPPRGTQQALVLVDEWIPPTPELDRATALENFALRYFASHGPATERDFAWWSKLALTDVRAALARLGDRLSVLTANGTDYLIAKDALDGVYRAPRTSGPCAKVHLLPGFDEYLLGYEDRSLGLHAEHFPRVVPGSNGIFLPLIEQEGRIVGTWRRIPQSQDAATEPEHFLAASPEVLHEFRRASAAYARFALS